MAKFLKEESFVDLAAHAAALAPQELEALADRFNQFLNSQSQDLYYSPNEDGVNSRVENDELLATKRACACDTNIETVVFRHEGKPARWEKESTQETKRGLENIEEELWLQARTSLQKLTLKDIEMRT